MLRRHRMAIAQGALTNSKHPSSHVKGIYPELLVSSKGCHVWDIDNKKYVDYICGLGTNLLGYGNDLISNTVLKHLYSGFSPSFPTVHEGQTAERVKDCVPFIEKIKFVKTGSEACHAAIKIARTYTGRKKILSEGYHGWHSEFTSLTPPAHGCPTCTDIAIFKSLDEIDDSVACVIVEPVNLIYDNDRRTFLQELRDRCTKHGVVLIFDEIITGARFKKFCVANDANIFPDLICLGKAIANGFPLALVGGKKELMDGPYFVSSTYAGEILSLVACEQTLKLLQTKLDYKIDGLWNNGDNFIQQFNAACKGIVELKGYPTRGVFEGDPLMIALLFQECCLADILFGKSWFFNFDLQFYTDQTITIVKEIMWKIRNQKVTLKGELPQSPFSLKARQ